MINAVLTLKKEGYHGWKKIHELDDGSDVSHPVYDRLYAGEG